MDVDGLGGIGFVEIANNGCVLPLCPTANGGVDGRGKAAVRGRDAAGKDIDTGVSFGVEG